MQRDTVYVNKARDAMTANAKPILVIGGGISGMTAAVEIAEVGYPVILVEKEAYLGGKVLGFHRYFPKMCPPACGFEINIRRIRQHPKITVYTLAEVKEITGTVGAFRASISVAPRYVTGKIGLDGSMADGLPANRPDDFNLGMTNTRALYLPNDRCYPPQYVLDMNALSDDAAAAIRNTCPEGAIDWEMTAREIQVDVGAIIVATGWRPYDARKLDNLGFGNNGNVITNVMMERLASKNGPTQGVIRRPSDDKAPANVAFVQCAGSRDDHHLPYCSAVCCMAALKQARYLIEQNGNINITLFYIDIRTIGRYEKFYFDLLDRENISFIKGKVAKISHLQSNGDLRLAVEDTLSGQNLYPVFDMVVLSTGVVPNSTLYKRSLNLDCDAYGFIDGESQRDGVYAVGCAKQPCDVSRATKDAANAALKAIQCLKKGA